MPVVCEDLGDELGMTPSLFQALFKPSTYLFGPLLSCFYRTNPKVDGKETAAKCQALFDHYTANPKKYVDLQ